MSSARELQIAIQKLAGTFGLKFTKVFTAKVTAVDSSGDDEERACTVEAILAESSVTIEGVHLSVERNDGFIQIPAVDSTVLVAQTPDNECYVIGFSDIDKVICVIDSTNKYEFSTDGFIWNGGLFGGMAKTGVIATKLNTLEALENAMKVIISAILTAGSGSPGTPVTNGSLAAYFNAYNVTPIVPTTQAEISDNKVKH